MVRRIEAVHDGDGGANAATRCAARFEIRFSRFLDKDGRALAPLPELARDLDHLKSLYRACVLTRAFDSKAVALQRTGKLGTYPSSLGQEATAVALGSAMQPDDVLLPTYRETGALLMRGVRMSDLLLYWGGDERGIGGMPFAGPAHTAQDFPICVPIATHAPHAAGVAYAFKHRREQRAVVCAVGDGATSKGDFYESMNAAGVWQLPLVFLIVNNRWAISVPLSTQTRAATLAQKAVAAGIEGEQVDGNDLIAVRHALDRALADARAGRGPRVIEALTYRMSDHTTADDARRYRSAEEVRAQHELDPLERLRKYLSREHGWSDADDEALKSESQTEIEVAVEEYLAAPPRPPETMFDHLFESLPAPLEAQREEVARRGRNG